MIWEDELIRLGWDPQTDLLGSLPWKVTPQLGVFSNNKKTMRRIEKLYMDDFHDLRRQDWNWLGLSKLIPWGSPLESDPPIKAFRK